MAIENEFKQNKNLAKGMKILAGAGLVFGGAGLAENMDLGNAKAVSAFKDSLAIVTISGGVYGAAKALENKTDAAKKPAMQNAVYPGNFLKDPKGQVHATFKA
jgi:hypothetical protein